MCMRFIVCNGNDFQESVNQCVSWYDFASRLIQYQNQLKKASKLPTMSMRTIVHDGNDFHASDSRFVSWHDLVSRLTQYRNGSKRA